MDFTAAFRHASLACIAFSPGSTFLATISGNRPRTLLIRASSTLQVIRSWDFDTDIHSIEWSNDGSFILAVTTSSQEDGVAYVVSLDPAKQADDGSDGDRGWVARIVCGSEGLCHATWTPPVGPRCVVLFSQNQIRASIFSLTDQNVSLIQGIKKAKLIWSPKRPNNFAVILRGTEKDSMHIFSCHKLASQTLKEREYILQSEDQWQQERSYVVSTNDIAGASWSPDGLFIATWESHLEYKVQIYSPLGHLRASFVIDYEVDTEPITRIPHIDTPPSLKSSQNLRTSTQGQNPATRSRKDSTENVAAVAGGGLGVRQVKWHPSGKFLAIGGYDEKVRILEEQEWSQCCFLDLSQRVVGDQSCSKLSTASFGPLIVWREPQNWFQETAARGIVSFEIQSLPVSPAAMRVDTDKANPKFGVSWTRWSPEGHLIASLNERFPFSVFIHVFSDIDGNPIREPYLVSLLQLNLPVKSLFWKPGHIGKLGIVCQSQAVYTWEVLEDPSGSQSDLVQRAEAVPIPTDDFSASNIRWSPDGQKIMIASDDAFCCAFEALDDLTS